jgi:16S rRNA (cytidine1402-2'-O)-methyltransferase
MIIGFSATFPKFTSVNKAFLNMKSSLYLIPVPISDKSTKLVLPEEVLKMMNRIDVFIVENIKTAQKYLRSAGIEINQNKPEFFILDEHTSLNDLPGLLIPIQEGRDVGLMSEAGMPALADPGEEFILLAHQSGFRVVPLPGPSSIIMALVASGLNGQNFAFNGYLPVKKTERIQTIKRLEEKVYRENQTQIFMETPYRNMALLEDITRSCRFKTLLCIATSISGKDEQILTKTIGEWKKKLPDIHKKPSVFVLGVSQ